MTDRRWKACLVGGAAAVVLAALGIRRKRQQEAEEANRPLSLFKVFMSRTVDKALLDTLHSGYITQGPQVEAFEAELRDYFGNPHVLTTNSCTAATHLAFRLLKKADPAASWPGYGPGDEVLSCPLTCTATNWPALANGLKLKWVDVNPRTGNICLEDLERKLSPTTKVILFVHWGGTPVDLDGVDAVVEKCFAKFGFRPKVIEDCAHAIGATYKGRMIGSHGHSCVFSLQAIKHVTCGDGGLLVLADAELYRRGKLLRWFGIDRAKRATAASKATDFRAEAPIDEWGYKFHMNDINATIGRENLKHASSLVGACRANGAFLAAELGNGRVKGVGVLDVPPGAQSAFWLFTLVLQPGQVGLFMDFMKERSIAASQVHTRNDLHPCVAEFKPPSGSLAALDEYSGRFCCVPVGWWLTPADLKRIVAAVKDFAAAN